MTRAILLTVVLSVCCLPLSAWAEPARAEAFLPEQTLLLTTIENVPAARQAVMANTTYRLLRDPKMAGVWGLQQLEVDRADKLMRERLGLSYTELMESVTGQAVFSLTKIQNINFETGVIRLKLAMVARVDDNPTLGKFLDIVVDRDIRRRAELTPGLEDPAPLFGLFGGQFDLVNVLKRPRDTGRPDDLVEQTAKDLRTSALTQATYEGTVIHQYEYAPRRYLSWAVHEGWLVVGGPYKTDVKRMIRNYRDDGEKSLLDNPAYVAARRGHEGPSMLSFRYVGVKSFWDRFNIIIPPAFKATWHRMGFDNLQQVSFSEHARDKGFGLRWLMTVHDGKLRGLPARLAAAPLEGALVKRVPADAVSCFVVGADVTGAIDLVLEEIRIQLWPYVEAMAGPVAPEVAKVYTTFRQDWLTRLGPGLSMWARITPADKRKQHGLFHGSLQLMENPDKSLLDGIDRLVTEARQAKAVMPEHDTPVSSIYGPLVKMLADAEAFKVRGIEARRLVLGEHGDKDELIVGVADHVLAFSTSERDLVEALKLQERSLLQADWYTRIDKALPGRKSGVAYVDSLALYDMIRKGVKDPDTPEMEDVREAIGRMGIDVEKLPETNVMKAYLSPLAVVLRNAPDRLIVDAHVPTGSLLLLQLGTEEALKQAVKEQDKEPVKLPQVPRRAD